ncbi:hypothetical protein H4582DRAFT_1965355 [Lactarius indigo]|nr:hypothetical protein H4582DRAFT_1965355 [Lactarius indigo]
MICHPLPHARDPGPTAIFIASWPTLVSCRPPGLLPGLPLKRVTGTLQGSARVLTLVVTTFLLAVVILLFQVVYTVYATVRSRFAIAVRATLNRSEVTIYSRVCFFFFCFIVCSSLSPCLAPV